MGVPIQNVVGYRDHEEEEDDDDDSVPGLEPVTEDDEDEEDEDDDYDETEYESVYFKYCFDGCETIDDVIESLKSLTKYFEDIKAEGHNLREPVDSGHCFLTKIVEPQQSSTTTST
jgi:hypothetical protein